MTNEQRKELVRSHVYGLSIDEMSEIYGIGADEIINALAEHAAEIEDERAYREKMDYSGGIDTAFGMSMSMPNWTSE